MAIGRSLVSPQSLSVRRTDPLRLIYLVSVLALVLVFLAWPRSREPVYAGRPITAWLDGGYEPAAMALEEIGPAAVPWLFQKLRRDNPRWDYSRAYRHLRERVPGPLRNVLPQPRVSGFDAERAANLLVGLGPPVLPALKAGLKDKNPAVRTACASALKAVSSTTAIEWRQ